MHPLRSKEERECFYCHKAGHVIADCLTLKRKQPQTVKQPKGVGLIQTVPLPVSVQPTVFDHDSPDPSYKPFILDGLVSLTSDKKDQCKVKILRDTGAAQSFILSDVLKFSNDSFCGSSVLVQGIEMGFVPVPLHQVQLQCDLVSGVYRVGVRPSLPVKGVHFILGNDIAGGKVLPLLELLEYPETQVDNLNESLPGVFPACAVTRAQSKKLRDVVNLSDSILAKDFATDELASSKPLAPPNTDKVRARECRGPSIECW